MGSELTPKLSCVDGTFLRCADEILCGWDILELCASGIVFDPFYLTLIRAGGDLRSLVWVGSALILDHKGCPYPHPNPAQRINILKAALFTSHFI